MSIHFKVGVMLKHVDGTVETKKPLTMDTSAREAMKDAAKCDKHCELQISANQ